MTTIDHKQAIEHCFQALGHPQGTRSSIAFVRGAEWAAEQLAAPATAPAQPEIVDLLAEMYELILANKVVLAEKSGGVWTWPDRAIEAVRKHRSGPAQPERTPMTKEQREQVARRAEAAMNGNVNLSWRDALMSETEAFHDIKETP